MKAEYGDNLEINWRHFSLEQINSGNGPEWKVWERKELREARALLASVAGEAAKRQGDKDAFDKFHMALLTARHAGDRVPLNEDAPLIEAAEKAGLDVERFKKDLDDPELLAAVAADHEMGRPLCSVTGFLRSSSRSTSLQSLMHSLQIFTLGPVTILST